MNKQQTSGKSMPNQRMRRVNQILREVVADELKRLKDPRIGFLTVTGVDTAPDLRNATVFYSVLGDDAAKEETAAALESSSARVRIAIGKQVRLKYLPHFRFRLDPAIAHGQRIEKLLKEIDSDT